MVQYTLASTFEDEVPPFLLELGRSLRSLSGEAAGSDWEDRKR